MQLTCTKCGAAIAPADINLQAAIAKCSQCGEVFGFAAQVPGALTTPATKPPVSMPKGFALAQQLNDLVITRHWFSPSHIALLFFCLFWDGFLVVWYTIAFTVHGPLIMFLFPLIHAAVGIFITYTMIAGFVNNTDFVINDRQITVTHYPMWWPGNITIPAEQIDQLFCEEVVSSNRNSTTYTYTVKVCLKGGDRLTLVKGLEQPNHAEYIEQQVEQRLRITDRPEPGEMAPV